MKTTVSTIPFDSDLLKSTRDNIASTAISIPPKDATCYLCGGDESEAPLVRDCSCKGEDNGWAHIQCIVKNAETISDNNSLEFSRGWKSCGCCKQPFKNEVAIDMSIRFIGYTSKKCPENEAIIINAHVQTLRSITNAYITTPRPCYNNKAREMAENIRLKIGQGNLSKESKIYLEAAICNCIGDIALCEGTGASLNEAVRHFEACRDLCQSIGAAVGEACRGLDAAKRLLYPTPSVDDIMSRLEGLTVTNPTQVPTIVDEHTTTIEAENSENNSKMKLDSIKMDWMKDDSEEDNSGNDTIGMSLPTTPKEPPNKRQKTKSSDKVENQTGPALDPMILDSPQEEYTLEFGNTNDETSSEDSNYDDNSDIDISSTTPTSQKSVDSGQLPASKNLIYGQSKAVRYAKAKLQYNSMKDNNVDKSPSRTTSVLGIYSGCYSGEIPGCSKRVQPAQVAALIRRVLPPPPVLCNEIEHELFGRASPGTDEYNTCETQVLNKLVSINLLGEEGFFKKPSKINPRICLAIGDDRRMHHTCRAMAEVIKQVYLSDCSEVMIWINDILRAVYTGEELEYLEAVLSQLDDRKKVRIYSVRNFLAGRSLLPVINIINEREVALSRIGKESSHRNPLGDKSEDTPKQKERNALARKLMNKWLAAGELPDEIKQAIIRAQLLLVQEKDACRDLVKKCRSAINNSKAGLTQLANNQPHHITAGTPRGEEIVSKETSTLHVDCHQSSDTNPPNIISSYTRSTKDNSEWNTHETMYMEARMTSTLTSISLP